ncbi:alpha/beta hydrolase [Streptomyces lavendulae]|uniref:alpha/beta hydrolase n=1 Tax=Streptomyces lavendulae TaxID=1914 RepID=UPI0037F298E4
MWEEVARATAEGGPLTDDWMPSAPPAALHQPVLLSGQDDAIDEPSAPAWDTGGELTLEAGRSDTFPALDTADRQDLAADRMPARPAWPGGGAVIPGMTPREGAASGAALIVDALHSGEAQPFHRLPDSAADRPLTSEELRRTNAGHLERALTAGAGLPCHVLVYDPEFEGVGRMAVALGDIETATHIAVLIPGMGSGPSNFDQLVRRARHVHDECRRVGPQAQTAVIAWQGYRAPRDIRKGKGEVSADDPAKDGSRLLNIDLAHWRALWANSAARKTAGLPRHPQITVNGFSYGSVVAGYSLMRPTHPGGAADTAKAAVSAGTRELSRQFIALFPLTAAAKKRVQGGTWTQTLREGAETALPLASAATDPTGTSAALITARPATAILKRSVGQARAAYRSEPLGGGHADYLVLFGSPGTGRRARHLNIPPTRVYAAAHAQDPISHLNYFSIDPTHIRYDPTGQVTRLRTHYTDDPSLTRAKNLEQAHNSYYDPPTATQPARESLTNLAHIITGNPHHTTTHKKRSGLLLEGHKNPLARPFTNPPTNTPVPAGARRRKRHTTPPTTALQSGAAAEVPAVRKDGPTFPQSYAIDGPYPRYSSEFSTRLLRDYPLPMRKTSLGPYNPAPARRKKALWEAWGRGDRKTWRSVLEIGLYLEAPAGTQFTYFPVPPVGAAGGYTDEYLDPEKNYGLTIEVTVPKVGEYTEGELWACTKSGREFSLCSVIMGMKTRYFLEGPYADPAIGFRFKAKIPRSAPKTIPIRARKFLPANRIPRAPEDLAHQGRRQVYLTSRPAQDPVTYPVEDVRMEYRNVLDSSGSPVRDRGGNPRQVCAPPSHIVKYALQADKETLKADAAGPYDIRVRTMNRVGKFAEQKPSTGGPTVESYPSKSIIIRSGTQKIIPADSVVYLEPLPRPDRFTALDSRFLISEMADELPPGATPPGGISGTWTEALQSGSGTRTDVSGIDALIVEPSGKKRWETSWFPTMEISSGNSTVRCFWLCTLPHTEASDPSSVVTGCEPNGLFDEAQLVMKASGITLIDEWFPADGNLYRFRIPGWQARKDRHSLQTVTEVVMGRETQRLQEQRPSSSTPAPPQRESATSGTNMVGITRSTAPKADLLAQAPGKAGKLGQALSGGSTAGSAVGTVIQFLDPRSDTLTNIETVAHGSAVIIPVVSDRIAVAMEAGEPVLRKIAYTGVGISIAANAYSLTQKLTADEVNLTGVALDVVGIGGDILIMGMMAMGAGATAVLVTGAVFALPALAVTLDSILFDTLDHPYDFMDKVRNLFVKVVNERLETAQTYVTTPLQQKIMANNPPGRERQLKLHELDKEWQVKSQQIARQTIISQCGAWEKWVEGLNPGILTKRRLADHMRSLGHNPHGESYSDRQARSIHHAIVKSVENQLLRHVDMIAAGQPLPDTAITFSPAHPVIGGHRQIYLPNAGFEQGWSDGWEPWPSSYVELNSTKKHSGERCAEFMLSNYPTKLWRKVDGLTAGKEYILRAWAWPWLGRFFTVGCTSQPGNRLLAPAIKVSGTGDWQQIEYRFKATTSSIEIQCSGHPQKSSGLMDDFTLTEVV